MGFLRFPRTAAGRFMMAAKSAGRAGDLNPDAVVIALAVIVFLCSQVKDRLFPEKPLTEAEVHFDLVTRDRTVFCASPDELSETLIAVSSSSYPKDCAELPAGFKLISKGPADGKGAVEVAALYKGKLSYFYVSSSGLKRLP
jgi:hypothetical protein